MEERKKELPTVILLKLKLAQTLQQMIKEIEALPPPRTEVQERVREEPPARERVAETILTPPPPADGNDLYWDGDRTRDDESLVTFTPHAPRDEARPFGTFLDRGYGGDGYHPREEDRFRPRERAAARLASA